MPRRPAPARSQEEDDALQHAGAGEHATATELLGEGADAGATSEDLQRIVDAILPERVQQALNLATPAHLQLLAEACYVFGIDPDPALKPLELAAQRFDAGEPNGPNPIPAYVSLVTAGGLKVRYPMDDDTEHRLRVVYNAFRVNKAGDREVLPLPQDLTLPREHVDGIVRTSDHQYRTGYLREGGADAATRKAALRELRQAGRIR